MLQLSDWSCSGSLNILWKNTAFSVGFCVRIPACYETFFYLRTWNVCRAIFTSCRNLLHEYKVLASFSLKAWQVKWPWGKNNKGLFLKSAQLLAGMSTGVNMEAMTKWSKPHPFFTCIQWVHEIGDDSVVQSRLPPFWCSLLSLLISW